MQSTDRNAPSAQTRHEVDERYIVVLKVGGNELDDDAFLFGLAKAVPGRAWPKAISR